MSFKINKSKFKVDVRPKTASGQTQLALSQVAVVSKLDPTITALFNSLEDDDTLSDESVAALANRHVSKAFEDLYQRGVNPMRAETLLVNELIPIGTGETESDNADSASINLNYGEGTNLKVNQVMRLIDLQRIIRKNILKVSGDFLEEYIDISNGDQKSIIRHMHKVLKVSNKQFLDLGSDTESMVTKLIDISSNISTSDMNVSDVNKTKRYMTKAAYAVNASKASRSASPLARPGPRLRNIIRGSTPQILIKSIKEGDKSEYLRSIARYVILDYIAQNSVSFITRIHELKTLLNESISIAQTELPVAEEHNDNKTSETPSGMIRAPSGMTQFQHNSAFQVNDRIANAKKLLQKWGIPGSTGPDGFSPTGKHKLTDLINADVAADKAEETFGSNKHMYSNLFANLLKNITFMQTLSGESPKNIDKSKISFTSGQKNLANGLNILKKISAGSMISRNCVINSDDHALQGSTIGAMLSAVSEDKDEALTELVAAVCYDQVAASNSLAGIGSLLATKGFNDSVESTGLDIENIVIDYFNKIFFNTGINSWKALSNKSVESFDYKDIAKNDNKLGSYLKSRFLPKDDNGVVYVPSEHSYEDNVHRADTFLNSPDYFFNKALESESLEFDKMILETKKIISDLDKITHDMSAMLGLDFQDDGTNLYSINGFEDDNSPLTYFYSMCDSLGTETKYAAAYLDDNADLAVPLIQAGKLDDLNFTADVIKGSFFANIAHDTNIKLLLNPEDSNKPTSSSLQTSSAQEAYVAMASEAVYYGEDRIWYDLFKKMKGILKDGDTSSLKTKEKNYPANKEETYTSCIANGGANGIADFNDSTSGDNDTPTWETHQFGAGKFQADVHRDYKVEKLSSGETDEYLIKKLNFEAETDTWVWILAIAVAVTIGIAIPVLPLVAFFGGSAGIIAAAVVLSPIGLAIIAGTAATGLAAWKVSSLNSYPKESERPRGVAFTSTGYFETILLTNASIIPKSLRIRDSDIKETEENKVLKIMSSLFGMHPNYFLKYKSGNGDHKEWQLADILDKIVEILQGIYNFFGGNSDGEGTLDDSEIYKPYHFKWNEQAGEYGGIFKTNTAQRYTLFTLFFARMYYKCLVVRYSSKDSHLYIKYYPTAWHGMSDALSRKTKDTDFATGGVYSEIGHVYNHAYNSAKNMIDEVSDSMKFRRSAILRNIMYLKQNTDEIREAVRRAETILQGNSSEIPPGEKLAINYLKKIGFLKNGLTFLNDGTAGALLKNYQKNYLLDFRSDEDESANPVGISVYPYFKLESYDMRDLKIMAKLFSKKGRGLTSNIDDLMGRKIIMHIGIPVGMIRALQNEAYSKTGELEYYYSNSIAIHVTKKNDLDPQIKYQARTYVFNLSKHIASLKTSDNYNEIVPPGRFSVGNHLENYADTWTVSQIKENIEILTASRKKPFYGIGLTGIKHLNTAEGDESQYDDEVYEAMLDNHIYDHYSKLYTYSTTGIDMSETMFPLDRNLIFEGKVDQAADNAYNNVVDELINRYPASNIVPSEAQEFYRVLKTIRSSMYFSSESRLASCLSTQCFERIFSIPISERDFALKQSAYNMDASDIYKSENMPKITLTNKRMISQNSISGITGIDQNTNNQGSQLFNNSPAKIILEYQKGLSQNKTDVSTFVIEVAILKSNNLS